MDDLVKLVGLAVLLGAAIIGAMVGWTVVQNETMVWFLLITTQSALVACAVGAAGYILHRCFLAGRTFLARSQEEQLTTARVFRTAGPAGALPSSSDAALISALLGGVPAGEVVDAVPTQIGDGDDD